MTNTLLFEETVSKPMSPELSATVPPLEITRLLPLPELPTLRSPLLVQSELLPVTNTLLFMEVVATPM